MNEMLMNEEQLRSLIERLDRIEMGIIEMQTKGTCETCYNSASCVSAEPTCPCWQPKTRDDPTRAKLAEREKEMEEWKAEPPPPPRPRTVKKPLDADNEP